MILAGGVIIMGSMLLIQKLEPKPIGMPFQPGGITISWIPESVRQWESSIVEMGKKYNVDPNLIAIIITMESGGNPKAESHVGAQGLMQVMPLTAQDISQKFLKEPRKTYDIYDPKTNIEFGTAYLAYLRDEFTSQEHAPTWNNTVELVAAGYNGGPGNANNLEQGRGLESAETVAYARDAYNMWRERFSGKSPTFERWKERGGSSLIEAAP